MTNDKRPETLGRTFRPGIHPADVELPGFAPHPGFKTRREPHPHMVIERDVPIMIRTGVRVYADIFRPITTEPVPVIVGYAPFGKHPHIDTEALFTGAEIPLGALSEFVPFEQFDPVTWTGFGYALAFVDGVGNWYSEGDATFFTPEEAAAGHDIVEWLAAQAWCTGKVGWGGVSYYAMTAWSVAATQPAHLAAILPWDAASDVYREAYMKAGIPNAPHIHGWMALTGVGTNRIEDMEAALRDHPTFDEFWQIRVADWSAITVPVYAVSEFGNDLHLRGTVEAWQSVSSPEKYLELRGDKEWQGFYAPESIERQRAFFDRYLKGERNGVDRWPAVRRAIRMHDDEWFMTEEDQWPPASVQHRRLWLDCAGGALTATAPEEAGSASYDSTDPDAALVLDYTFDHATEVVGHATLRLWVQAQGSNDADLFVGIEKLDAQGQRVRFPFSQMYNDGPLGFGWLRASHRSLDATRSRPDRPYHSHASREWLVGGEIVPVDIELWPLSVRFEPGESIRVIVKGTAIRVNGGAFEQVLHPLHNYGRHIIHAGDRFDSHLLLPVAQALTPVPASLDRSH